MNILDLSEDKQRIIADKMDLDLVEMQNQVINNLLEADVSNSRITVIEDREFRLSNDLAVFIY
ncbi:MAG: hypothetical protein PHG15_03865 [Acinetobacter sp.]|uniref:hypothetical protein n=1 Tax=Acinetobacter sp. TaxID=472 RepID=UPI002617B91A|nr:hypothetical protein [Acinetobacter sp.]MDD2944949.1 hypothetical protein [Acinetobacter sp.]